MSFSFTYFFLFLSFVWLCLTRIMQKKNKLPPGPFPLPVVGSMFKLGTNPHKSLGKLANAYGPLMTLKLGSVTTVVASSPEMAKEILQKNDQSFASRPIPDAIHALDHHKFSMIWLPASPQWRNLRKVCNTHLFVSQRLEVSQGLRRQKVEELLAYVQENCMKKRAVNIGQLAFITVLNLISNTVFSTDLTHLDSNYSQEFMVLVRRVLEEGGRLNFTDYFPCLGRINPQGIRRRMEGYFVKLNELFDGMIKQRLESRQLGVSSSCSDFLDTLLDYKQEDGLELSDPAIKSLLKDIFIAGTESTSATVEWVMAELLRNPDTMEKAKLELKNKFGNDKVMDESDIVDLPYLQAVVKEAFRLHPPVPLLVPHKAETTVEICGFIVPKNTQVLINVWAIGHDPNIWENPTSFIPDRFLNSNIDSRGRDFELIPFGAGRRMCPGLSLAHKMVYLMLASLLRAFDWTLEEGRKPEDMDMKEKLGITLQKASPLVAIPIKM